MSNAREEEYKGKPVIVLRQFEQDQYPFSFGIKKAQMVITHLEDIRRFVQKYQREVAAK